MKHNMNEQGTTGKGQSLIKSGEFIAVSALVCFANLFDAWSTFFASSYLSLEGNPFFRGSAGFWGGVIVAKVGITALSIFTYAFYMKYRRSCYPQERCGQAAFIRYFLLGRHVSWVQLLYTPCRPKHALCWAGGVLGITACMYYTMLSINNVAIGLYNMTFDAPLHFVALPSYFLNGVVQLLLCLAISFAWMNYCRYREYRQLDGVALESGDSSSVGIATISYTRCG